MDVVVNKTDVADLAERRELIDAVVEAVKKTTRGSRAYEEVARMIKTALDEKRGKYWQCVVGSRFGTKIEHCPGTFLYVKVDDYMEIVVYKSKSEPI